MNKATGYSLPSGLFSTESSRMMTTRPSRSRLRFSALEMISRASSRLMIGSVGQMPNTPRAKIRRGRSPTTAAISGESPDGPSSKISFTGKYRTIALTFGSSMMVRYFPVKEIYRTIALTFGSSMFFSKIKFISLSQILGNRQGWGRAVLLMP